MQASQPSILLSGAPSSARRNALRDLEAAHEAAGDLCVFADLHEPFGAAFGGTRRLFRPLIDVLLTQAGGQVHGYAPEVLALWPELRSRSEFAGASSIDEIALGGTKRRLHKDSEKVFRIIHALTSLLQGLAHIQAENRRRVVLAFDNLESADRLTLCVLYHVMQRCGGSRAIRLIGACDPSREAGAGGARRWLWALHQTTDAAHPAAASGWSEHARMVGLVAGHDGWSRQPVDDGGMASSAWEALAGDPPPWLRLACLGIRSDDAPAQASLVPHPVLDAVREQMSAQDRIEAHRAAADRLRTQGADDESALAEQAFHEIHSMQLGRAGETAVRALEASFGFAFNFEALLLCAAEFLYAADGRPEARGSAVAVELYVALVECYLEKYPCALALFADIDARVGQPVLRAQIHFYMGLIEAKCLGNFERAQQMLRAGLDFVDPLRGDTWPAALEFGWLSNAYAFTLWKRRLPVEASAYVTRALEVIEPFEAASPQILNLKINLLNNLSVLHEMAGDFGAARAVWEQLGALSEIIPGGRFEKSFLYRRGWLFLQDGNYEDAYRDYVDSYEVAARYRDQFHMDIISSACGYIGAALKDFDIAGRWYARNLELRLALDDRPGACEARVAMAVISRLAGDEPAAAAHLDKALESAYSSSQTDRVRSLLAPSPQSGEAASPDHSDDNRLPALTALQPPRMKLTTPFSIGHLVSVRAIQQSTHVSLASASIAP
ncbi:MAG: hypothetical protein ING59_09485 [Burkholderiales bacterium]|nr:hypothetical protein [Burkholderiales bacterium]